MEHRRVKKFYIRVHKATFTRGIAKQQRRERILHKIKEHAPKNTFARKRKYGGEEHTASKPYVAFKDDETLPPSSPHEHHHISTDTRHKLDLLCWLGEHKDDPAVEV